MNIYDFDKTIFYPNSLIAFAKYSFKKNHKLALRYTFKTIWFAFLYLIEKETLNHVIEQLCSFIKDIPNPQEEIENFWDCHLQNISTWYLEQKQNDDIIISASPEFLIKPICNRLGVRCFATKMDINTMKIIDKSCYGKIKTFRILEEGAIFSQTVDNFYSDSLSDTPLALCAQNAFQVKHFAQKVVPWPEFSKKFFKKFKKKFGGKK